MIFKLDFLAGKKSELKFTISILNTDIALFCSATFDLWIHKVCHYTQTNFKSSYLSYILFLHYKMFFLIRMLYALMFSLSDIIPVTLGFFRKVMGIFYVLFLSVFIIILMVFILYKNMVELHFFSNLTVQHLYKIGGRNYSARGNPCLAL